ncbi:MAG: ATP-binding protein [Rubrivivax sp.]|nr:ATP-binding protein [Pyrinomonadaceae bacterium]
MRSNPGGMIPPSQIMGRDALITRLWRVLEGRGVVLSAERRMGKTSIIKKMVAEPQQNCLCFYRDLEGIRTPLEFIETIFSDVEGCLSRSQRLATKARGWLKHLTGLEIGGVVKFPDTIAAHWKSLLVKIIEDLAEQQEQTVIFFWDEMPLMLYNIKQRQGEDSAMEVLDALRSLRLTYPSIRMVFTGSIGLHNVITALKRAGYANDPTNDMDTINVPSLSDADAGALARQLIEGESLTTDSLQATADAITDAVDNIPYFIHHVVDQLAQRGGKADMTIVNDIVNTCLTDPQDRWHLRYYRERIDVYYLPDERPFALNLLDVLSVAEQPMSFAEAFNLLKAKISTEDGEKVRDVLTLLQRDHYVIQQSGDGRFRFQFPLIQRFWRLNRGLV